MERWGGEAVEVSIKEKRDRWEEREAGAKQETSERSEWVPGWMSRANSRKDLTQ